MSGAMDKRKKYAVVYKETLPWKRYAHRDLRDHTDVVSVVYEIDHKEPDKQKSFVIFEELLGSLPGMRSALEECRALIGQVEDDGEQEVLRHMATETRRQKIDRLSSKLHDRRKEVKALEERVGRRGRAPEGETPEAKVEREAKEKSNSDDLQLTKARVRDLERERGDLQLAQSAGIFNRSEMNEARRDINRLKGWDALSSPPAPSSEVQRRLFQSQEDVGDQPQLQPGAWNDVLKKVLMTCVTASEKNVAKVITDTARPHAVRQLKWFKMLYGSRILSVVCVRRVERHAQNYCPALLTDAAVEL